MERSTHRAHHRESLPSSMKPLECQYSTEEVRNLEGDTNQNDSTRRSLAQRPEYSIRREGIVDARYAEQGPGVVEVVFDSVDVSIFENGRTVRPGQPVPSGRARPSLGGSRRDLPRLDLSSTYIRRGGLGRRLVPARRCRSFLLRTTSDRPRRTGRTCRVEFPPRRILGTRLRTWFRLITLRILDRP